MKLKNTLIAVAAGVVAACQIGPTLEERENAYLNLNETHWRNATTTVDDPLDPAIEINTFEGYKDQIFGLAMKNDQFLRAYVYRKDGAASIQGYVTYEDPNDWLSPTMVGFADVIPIRRVTRVDYDAYACGGGGCIHYEEMVFDLSRADLEALIAYAETSDERFVRFRVLGQTGRNRDGRFHVNEMKAMLAAVEAVEAVTG